jgi:putative transposase
MRTDNGLPFAAPTALYRLSKLAVWWLRLGIRIERIAPGKPQQNGRHERMHLTLKRDATKPAGDNLLQQQARFDTFLTRYNEERPHAALAMKTPAELSTPSSRVPRRARVGSPGADTGPQITRAEIRRSRGSSSAQC